MKLRYLFTKTCCFIVAFILGLLVSLLIQHFFIQQSQHYIEISEKLNLSEQDLIELNQKFLEIDRHWAAVVVKYDERILIYYSYKNHLSKPSKMFTGHVISQITQVSDENNRKNF